MADLVKYKRPSEDYDVTMSFSDKLASTESVDTVVNGSSVTALDSSGASATSTVLGTVTPSAQTLKVHVTAGTNLEDYTVTFHAKATTSGDEYEKVLLLRVRTQLEGGF